MSELLAATVITREYLPFARVLAESLAEHTPSARLHVVLVDDPPNSDRPSEPFAVLSPLDLGLEERELHRRALMFDPQGLISSLRPLVLSQLLESGADSVLLLDADMFVLAPIDDLWERAADAGVLLSPHSISTDDDRTGGNWREQIYLTCGTFNGGFLGVGRSGRLFLEWIAKRVERDCVRDLGRGLLYSQTWLNLVPALFPHQVLRDEGVNTTAHVLRGEDITPAEDGWTVRGTPLRLFHFTGFNAADTDALTGHLPGERGGLAGRPHVAELCALYGRRLRACGWPAPQPYLWGRLPDGRLVDEPLKARYRGAVLAAEAGVADEPPDPFVEPAEFDAWLGEGSGDRQPGGAESVPEVSILVPTHNALRYCSKLLRTLRRTKDVAYEVIVIDNASRWPTRTYLRAMSRLRRIDKLELNERNALFAAANNQAARLAHPASRYVLLLNSDVEIKHPLWLRHLVDVHRRGATGLGLLDDASGTRSDGYCLLVDRDVYDQYGLNEAFPWWWCVSRLQAELLRDGYTVTAIRDHDHLLHHYGARSGSDFAGAQGIDTDASVVRAWFRGRSARVLRSIGE